MKLIYTYIFLSSLLLILACSTESSSISTFSGNDAIAKVVKSTRDVGFPTEEKKIAGTIHGGGKPPGLMIPGELKSSAKKKGANTFVVTLTEYWDAKDFRDSKEKTGTLSSYWKYEVTPTEVKFLEQGGDTSPNLIN